jgi:hypothetical protein
MHFSVQVGASRRAESPSFGPSRGLLATYKVTDIERTVVAFIIEFHLVFSLLWFYLTAGICRI